MDRGSAPTVSERLSGRRVVVTGTSGRLGGALAARLVSMGVGVVGVDRVPGPRTSVVADLATAPLVPIVEGASAVVHCAALHAPHRDRFDDAAFEAVNVVATARLLDAASTGGVARFVFLSTTSVYGNALDDPDAAVWVDETVVPRARDVYDRTKLAAEAIVADADRGAAPGGDAGRGLRTITLRVARCFPESHRDVVVNRLYRGLDRRDAVAGMVAALEADLDRHHVLNLAGPRVFEPGDLVELRHDAQAVVAPRLPWLPDEFRRRGWALPASIDRVYVSDRATEVLGHRPRHGVRSALAEPPGDTRAQPSLAPAC